MKMQMNKLALAVAGALSAGMAGHAGATAIGTYTTANTADVYFSGASAQDGGIEKLMRRLCAVGTLDQYTASNQSIYFCQPAVSSGITLSSGKTFIAVHKSSVNGSGNGVQPVANSTPVAFLDLALIKTDSTNATPRCSASGTAVVSQGPVAGSGDTIGLPAYTTHACTITTVAPFVQSNSIPDAGFSDVEPALFGASPAELANLSVQSANSVIFGIPVSLKLRDALQTAQGLTSGSETVANMPSLTSSQVASIFNGTISTWNSFAKSVGPFTTTGSNALTNTVSNNIYIARRLDSSGTQTFAKVNFLGEKCINGIVPFVLPVGSTPATSGGSCSATDLVFAGNGGGDLTNCLNAHDTAGRWAIGILSTETATPAATVGSWRFIKLDGYAPTQLNVFQGKYKYWSEQSIQWRPSLAGDSLSVATAVASKLADPDVIAQIVNGINHPWGKGSLMGLATSGIPVDPTTLGHAVTETDILLNPVNSQTRSPNGFPNNCQPAVVAFPTSVGSN